MESIDEKKMQILQPVIKLKKPLDEEKAMTISVQGEKFNIETEIVKEVLGIVNIQPIEITEKEDLLLDLLGLVCDIKKGSFDGDKVGLSLYEIDEDEGKLTEIKIESEIVAIITEIVDIQKIEDKEKSLLYEAIILLVCEL